MNYFKFIDFKKNLKIGFSSVGKIYTVCLSKKCNDMPPSFNHISLL